MDPPKSQDHPSGSRPTIYTYHHVPCSSLVLATTHVLTRLPSRAAPGLDHSVILPLPTIPLVAASDDSEKPTDGLSDEYGQYSLLLQTQLAARPVVVRREDGFEKRRAVRCGRCAGAIGYFILDDAQRQGEGKKKRVLYLLPGGLVETPKMLKGERQEDGEGWWTDGVDS